jgi:hypothetical protein
LGSAVHAQLEGQLGEHALGLVEPLASADGAAPSFRHRDDLGVRSETGIAAAPGGNASSGNTSRATASS